MSEAFLGKEVVTGEMGYSRLSTDIEDRHDPLERPCIGFQWEGGRGKRSI